MNLLKLKRGSGHIEIIISFVLFVGFVSFLFYMFNPFQNTSDTDYADRVFLKIEEKILTSISSVSLVLNGVDFNTVSCFSINDLGLISDLGCNSEKEILVKDKNGNIVNADINYESNTINIKVSEIADVDDKSFYTLYCSGELIKIPTTESCTSITSSQYTIGLINDREYWSKKKLDNFNNSYSNNYNELKSSVIPEGNDFSFIIYVFGGDKVYDGNKNPPGRIKVNSRSYPIDILDERANVKKYSSTIIVW